jgi:hypothetical protein
VLNFRKGPEWEKYRIHKSDDLEEMFEIYRYYPTMTHGHETPTPDGEYFAKDANPTEIIRTRDGHIETIDLSHDGSQAITPIGLNTRDFSLPGCVDGTSGIIPGRRMAMSFSRCSAILPRSLSLTPNTGLTDIIPAAISACSARMPPKCTLLRA